MAKKRAKRKPAKGRRLPAPAKPVKPKGKPIIIQGVPVEFIGAWTKDDSSQVFGISEAAATPGTEENRILSGIVGPVSLDNTAEWPRPLISHPDDVEVARGDRAPVADTPENNTPKQDPDTQGHTQDGCISSIEVMGEVFKASVQAADSDANIPPTDEQPSTQSTEDSPPIASDGLKPANNAQAREVARNVCRRLRVAGVWTDELDRGKDIMLQEAIARGMDPADAKIWAWRQLEAMHMPDTPVEGKSCTTHNLDSTRSEESSGVRGLGEIPDNWPELPDNASLAVELAWVQAQRLRVVEDRGNVQHAHLDRASTPAPSHAALGWLETSCRSYAKYTDVVARTLAAASTDDSELVRRERVSIAECRTLLEQMIEDEG